MALDGIILFRYYHSQDVVFRRWAFVAWYVTAELFQEKYTFDGWEVEVHTENPGKIGFLETGEVDGKVQTYELFWYPKTVELATELITLLDSMKEHTLFENCDFKLTILPRGTVL